MSKFLSFLTASLMLGGSGAEAIVSKALPRVGNPQAATPTLPDPPKCYKCKGPAHTIDIRTRLSPDAPEQIRKDVETALQLGGVTYQCNDADCKAVWMVLPQQINAPGDPGNRLIRETTRPMNRKQRRRQAALGRK